LGNEFFGKKGERSSEKPQPRENPKPKPIPFHCDHYGGTFQCDHYGRDEHLNEFCFRRREERFARDMANKVRYRSSRGVLEPRDVPSGEGVVRTIPTRDRCECPT
jgi:hypothetical protein